MAITNNIRIYMIDDDRLLLDVFAPLLKDTVFNGHSLDFAGGENDIKNALTYLKNAQIDVVILDWEMPEMNGLEVAREIRKIRPDIRILFLTRHNDLTKAYEALQQGGAKGFILKDSRKEVFHEAIVKVYHNQAFIDPDIKTSPHAPSLDEEAILPQDYEIFRYILEEYTTEEIGEKILAGRPFKGNKDPRAMYVENRRRTLMSLLGCANLVGLVKYVLRDKLIPGYLPLPVKPKIKEHYIDHSNTRQIINVFITDDQEILIEGLAKKLLRPNNTNYEFQIVGTALDAATTLEKLGILNKNITEKEHKNGGSHIDMCIDVLLLDNRLPDRDGLDLLEDIRHLYPQIRILMLTLDSSPYLADLALEKGAAGYLSKTEITTKILADTVIHLFETKDTLQKKSNTSIAFEPNEIAVLQMIWEEKTSQEIADALFPPDYFPENTKEEVKKKSEQSLFKVERMRSSMIRRTGAKSVVGLMVYAWRYGIVK